MKSNFREYLRFYWSYIKPYWKYKMIILVTVVFLSILDLSSPMLIKFLIDYAFVERDLQMVYLILGLSIGVMILQNVIYFLQDKMIGYIRCRLNYDLRLRVYKKVAIQDVTFFQKNRVGELMTRIMQEIRDVVSLFATTFTTIFNEILNLTVTIIVMFYLNWKLTIISCISIPFVILGIKYFNYRLREGNTEIMNDFVCASDILQDNLSGSRELKILWQDRFGVLRFARALHRLIQSQMKIVNIRIWNRQILAFIYAIAPISLILLGGQMVVKGAITIGSFVAFFSYLEKMYSPVRNLASLNIDLQQTLVAFKRFYDLHNSLSVIAHKPAAKTSLARVRESIQIQNISFSHDHSETILKDFSLTLKPGQMIGVFGRNGTGKSTLINLLSGLLQPQNGAILLDGIPLAEIKQGSLRKLIGLIPQNIYLFNLSILDNIKVGRRISEERIDQLTDILHLKDFIAGLPLKYNTYSEKNGENFSGGQRQKIGLIRVLARDPQIILLDEATSAMDAQSEKALFEYLLQNREDKIIIFISHNRELFKYADHIIDLEEMKAAKEKVI